MSREETRQADINASSPGVNSVVSVGNKDDIQDGTNDSDHIKEYEKEEADLNSSIHELEKNILKLRIQNKKKRESFLKQQLQAQQMLMVEIEQTGLADSTIRDVAYQSLPEISPMPSAIQGMFDLPSTPCSSLARNIEPSVSYETDSTIRDVAYQSLPESSQMPSAIQGMFDLPSTPCSSLVRNIEPSLSFETGKMRQEQEAAASQIEEQANLISLERQQILGPDTDNMPVLLGPKIPQKTVISQVPQDDSSVKPAQTKPAPPAISPKPAKPRPAVPLNPPKPSVTTTKTVDDILNQSRMSSASTNGGERPRIREGGSFNAKKNFFENEIQEQERQTKTQAKHFKYFSELEPAKMKKEEDPTIRDVAYQSLQKSSSMPSAIQGMFDLPSTPCSSLVRNIEPSLSYETGKMRQEREAASQVEEQVNLMSLERQQILGPDTDNMPLLLGPETPQKTVISQVPQDDTFVKPAQTKPAPPTYGGDGPRIREGDSFNEKKKFFENKIQEQERQTKTRVEERRMLLIGKTGHGKSFTGNTILGRDDAFEVSCYSESKTPTCKYGSAQRFGKKLVVVDTPGMFDTKMTNDAITEELVRACGFLSPGFHAILLVLRAGERHTEENRQVVDIYQRLFGQKLFKYAFLIITSWDTVEKEIQSLENFFRHGSESVRQLLDLCEKRCFVVSNQGEPSVKVKQVNALLEGIETNLARFNGRCFSNLVFKRIEFYLFLHTQNKQITAQAQNESELQKILASSDEVSENKNQDYRENLSTDGHSGIFGRLIRALRRLFDKQLRRTEAYC